MLGLQGEKRSFWSFCCAGERSGFGVVRKRSAVAGKLLMGEMADGLLAAACRVARVGRPRPLPRWSGGEAPDVRLVGPLVGVADGTWFTYASSSSSLSSSSS